ncbi:MAG: WYL domain-containing protein [Smithellaceae bacterium]|jgi:predicted DNA-binding transcriptional regulator YafY|nr:WYL domain-containing protein [Smithellaceae bacterium]MDD3259738.1 WYL domain-containing protein [Smithellaceae bacterium]MDD3848892.1 WYL domain-containing protein [Smithellaceae bacterium]HOG11866.1 WYL domain-containing protein [Smithellaceae bacterium]HOQ72036.1 WYL domain-containing protein [Smithellaceae bacterium]
MAEENRTRSKMIRLGRILRLFMEKEKITVAWLAGYFRTTPRTIQRDLMLLKESGFPLHEEKKGTYGFSRDLVKNLEVFDDTELALMVALKNIVGQLGKPFQKAADDVLDRLYDCVTSMPVFVKIDDAIPMDASFINRMVKAIREKRQVGFRYTGNKKTHDVQMEPYRVVYYGGFWYLIGNEPVTGILKRYALDKIKDLRLLTSGFKTIPENLDSVLKESANIWFAEKTHLTVTVLVDSQVSHYFKRRKMFPTQEIREERPDGSLVVVFRVGHFEAIRDILKSWIPHISILEPEEFRRKLLAEVKDWVAKQTAAA